MNFNQYQQESLETAPPIGDTEILNVALGLNGEAGEFADMVKKTMFQGHGFPVEDYIRELGDILWYISRGASVLGVTLEDIAIRNREKLSARYPNGFEVERSRDRTV